ncbi:MAG: PAS domain S-box protein, partial [Deltaproteobacteria bacterium]|nr:PAS domain S-box protein [Deltaproteobacteria bacterium]
GVDLKNRLQWLMFFRVVVASFFLGMAAVSQLQRGDSYREPYLVYLYGLAAAVYLLTFVYAVILPSLKRLQEFAYAQVLVDVVLVTALVFITGGSNSVFPFMYNISIIAASILLYLAGGIVTATFASICYGSLIVLQYNSMIAPLQMDSMVVTRYAGAPLYFPIVINVAAFYLVAFLGSFLAEQARKSRTQLQEKQIDIEHLEALNENIIQSVNSGLVTLDDNKKIITFNRAAQEITELGYDDVYMKSIRDIFPSLSFPEVAARSDSTQISPRYETTFVRRDGKEVYLGFSVSVLKDREGSEMGTILTFQDLTALKEMQEYVQRTDRLAAVGRLAAGIAHEIRNPLASISGSI